MLIVSKEVNFVIVKHRVLLFVRGVPFPLCIHIVKGIMTVQIEGSIGVIRPVLQVLIVVQVVEVPLVLVHKPS